MSAPTKAEVSQQPSPNGQAPSHQEGDAVPGISNLPARQLWRSTAADGLRSAWKQDPHGDAWKRLGKLLSDHKPPKSLRTGGKAAESPLQWGAAADATPPDWCGAPSDQLKQAAEAWQAASRRGKTDPAFVLESLWWAYALPELANTFDSRAWWGVVDCLFEVTAQAVDASLGDQPTAEMAYAHQVLGGELPLVLSQTLPDAQPLRKLRKPATAALTEGILALTDGEGMPTARVFERLPLLLACWTRCRAWAEQTGKPCWSNDAETQYEWLVRQALRLCRGDGSLALTPAGIRGGRAMLDLALDMAGDVSDNAAAAERLGVKAYQKIAGKADPPEPSVNSEWSAMSVLAADWQAKAQRATVSYADQESRIEYSVAGALLISGLWTSEVKVDGKTLAPVADWDEQCWFSDDDCDYLELSLDLEGDAKLERQVLIAREDRVAYLADIVQTGSDRQRSIEVITRLPLAAGITFAPEQETRDGWLAAGDKRLAGVVPAALPEWRVDPRVGELTQEDDHLVMRHAVKGRNLCCPLFLDAAPSRFAKQRTWRQLTVAESLQPVGPDVAVGYRFQSGKDQWVTYRSLDKPANRTLIGHNLASECLFGRFLDTGEVDEFFEIEND
ncbi:hypothetical protein Pla123a_26780 [Posidoniimonas polymericola]|uniref:Heparinase II/III-like protein n=1 Tax=Posidoniimonas polymericola TaxID=2528002 RepID=A0A5C5YLU2_9BACT|nr:hypothetical protein [Posidoniimonas polymericola]TWT75894.1 hypothetical protein Pla123a_26780 [Posidoniimonas polymericola]